MTDIAETLRLLDCVPDPLLSGVALARTIDSSAKRLDLLESIVSRYGERPDARTLQALSRLGRDLVSADPDEAYRFSERLVRTKSAAAMWLAAAILEYCQRHDEAVAALESITEATWGEERALRLLACARNLIQAGRHAAGWNPLREAIRCAENRQTLVLADQLLSRARKMDRPPARVKKRVALIGSGSLAFWAPVLRPVAFAAGIDVDLFVGEFEQYQQEILSPDSPLAQFNPEVVILATSWHSLGLPDETADPDQAVGSYIELLRPLWTQCAQRWGASVIQHNFEIPEVDPFGRLSARLARRPRAPVAADQPGSMGGQHKSQCSGAGHRADRRLIRQTAMARSDTLDFRQTISHSGCAGVAGTTRSKPVARPLRTHRQMRGTGSG